MVANDVLSIGKRSQEERDDSLLEINEQPHAKKLNVEKKQVTRPKACVHEVSIPPTFSEVLDEKIHGTIQNPQYAGERAKSYPFTLDSFQETSVACLERKESVLVSAHTSAGKTAIAEYAIAMAFRDKQRVIYTSPLKALSNQKYRELSEEFKEVGLMTGDVTISPNAPCTVMTTEILRSMLYRGSEILREVAWVIFDEIHYMRDRERGVVWEESIIFLPPGVRMVFLSATLSNAKEFSDWISYLSKQPCHVVYTDFRPTPLQHYAFPLGGGGLYLIVDDKGSFREDNFGKLSRTFESVRGDVAVEGALASSGDGKISGRGGGGRGRGGRGGRGGGGGRGGNQGPSDIYKIVKMIMDKNFEPVIVFSFSRRECESHAMSLSKLDFTSDEEKTMIDQVFHNAVNVLSEEDRKLPAIEHILPILRRGIGVHHSGLLPLLKEMIEILFQEGLIKALFATETFAMGLNMPAKTVVFTSVRKWDGEEHRWMSSGEYIQMSGRAGRRGKDARGICIVMIDESMSAGQCKEMVLGKPDPLSSSFRLTYYALLNLMSRAEGQFNTEYVIAHSFHQFQHDKQIPEIQKQIEELEKEAAMIEGKSEEGAEEYAQIKFNLGQLEKKMMKEILRPDRSLPFLRPGRVVQVKDGSEDWGWGIVVNVVKKVTNSTNLPGNPLSSNPSTYYIVDTLLRCAPSADDSSTNQKPSPCPPGTKGELHVIPVQLPLISNLSSLRAALPEDLRTPEARLSVLLSLDELRSRFSDGFPLLDPIQDMGINDEEFSDLIKQIEEEEKKLIKHPLFQKNEQKNEKHELFQRKSELNSQIQALKLKTKSSQMTMFKTELRNRSRVLKRLGHISSDSIIQLKGRAACYINTADELLITELMFEGAFNDMDCHQLVGLCSLFLPAEKSNESIQLSNELANPLRLLQTTAKRIAEIQREEKLEIDVDEYVLSFKPVLMDVMYSWSKGKTFAEVCDMTDVFEGTIVRSARRLDELLNEVALACKAVGESELEKKFVQASESIRRGIMFANSLYLD